MLRAVPTIYSIVVFQSSTAQRALPGTEFRWKTFGVTIDSTVLEFVRYERVA
jgi:hypothetical protein